MEKMRLGVTAVMLLLLIGGLGTSLENVDAQNNGQTTDDGGNVAVCSQSSGSVSGASNLEEKMGKKVPKVHNLPTVDQIKSDLRRASEITKTNVTKVRISPLGVDPEEYKRKIKEYRDAGIDVENDENDAKAEEKLSLSSRDLPTIRVQSYTSCDDLVVSYSWVFVNNDDYRYYAHDTSCTVEYSCSTTRPSESSYSDIHLEEWYYFYSDGVRPSVTTRGLIVFAGSNDSCGTSSTHLRDSNGNLQTYSDLPLDNPGGWYIYGAHILTTPCPHRDCVTWYWLPGDVADNPQRLVFTKYQTST